MMTRTLEKYFRQDIPSSLKYFVAKLKIPYVFLVIQNPKIDVIKDDIRIISADRFLRGLV